MLYGDQRSDYRDIFFEAWRKYRAGEALQGVENLIVEVARLHPEYHAMLEDREKFQDSDYLPEMGQINPFLHMGMHVSILEQLSIDDPRGIRERYQRLLEQTANDHDAQHRMMDCLGEMLWQAQSNNTPPSALVYFDCLDRLKAK